MTNVKFSQFQKATQSKDTDEIAILQDGVNKMIPSPVLESKIINKTVTRVIDQGGASLNVINLKGVVPTYADLATITPTPELNDAYQVEADGLVYVYTENGFQTEGEGFKVQAEPTGIVEEGNTQAVSGGEVYKAFLNKHSLVLNSKILNIYNTAVKADGLIISSSFVSSEITLPNDWSSIEVYMPQSGVYGLKIDSFFRTQSAGGALKLDRQEVGNQFNLKICCIKANVGDFYLKINSESQFNFEIPNFFKVRSASFATYLNESHRIILINGSLISIKNELKIFNFSEIYTPTSIRAINNNIYVTHTLDNKCYLTIFQYNNNDDSITLINNIILSEGNLQNIVKDVVYFNEKIYILIDITGQINIVQGVNQLDLYKTTLYEVTSNVLSNPIVLTNGLEDFGNKFVNDVGATQETLPPIYLTRSNISIQGNDLIVSFVANRTSLTQYNARVFFKKVDLVNNSYINYKIDPILRVYSFKNIKNSTLSICKRYYENNGGTFFSYANTKITLYDSASKKHYVLIDDTNDYLEIFSFVEFNNKILSRRSLSEGNFITHYFNTYDLDVLNQKLYPLENNNSLYINEYKNLQKSGDSILINKDTQLVDYFSFNAGAVKQFNYITCNTGQQKKIIFNGYSYIDRLTLDYVKTPHFNRFQTYFPENNSFVSRMFRIPTLTKMTNGALISAFDVRYCTGYDYDEISGGVSISYDGGRNWTDNKIVFPRTQMPGYRTHDLSIVVDSDIRSTNYGRVWAIAKCWNANVNSTNRQYWIDNPQSYDMLMSYSDDNGITWMTPYSIKNLFTGKYMYSGGCQAGIVLRNGTLAMTVYAFDYATNKSNVAILYKELNSSEWKVSNYSEDYIDQLNESSLIQDVDGSLLLSCRSTSDNRYWLRMSDLNGDFTIDNSIGIKKDVVCQASFFRHRNTYFYVAPDYEKNSNFSRKNTTVFYSYDLIKWEELLNLTGDISTNGYSAIYVDDNVFTAIYEDRGLVSVDLSNYRNVIK